jgi:hypothetical protein
VHVAAPFGSDASPRRSAVGFPDAGDPCLAATVAAVERARRSPGHLPRRRGGRFRTAAERLSRLHVPVYRCARGGLVVDPCDEHHVADTLRAALTMPLDERTARWQEAFESIRSHDVTRWRDRFLALLAG